MLKRSSTIGSVTMDKSQASASSSPNRRSRQSEGQLSSFAILAGQLVDEQREEVKLNVLSKLAELAGAGENKRAIAMDKITMSKLLTYAGADQPLALRKQAMRALGGLCSEELNQAELWERACGLILAAAQTNEDLGIRHYAYWALVFVSTDAPEVQEAMWATSAAAADATSSPSVRELLLAACAQDEDAEIRTQALWVLSNITCLVANKALMWTDEPTRLVCQGTEPATLQQQQPQHHLAAICLPLRLMRLHRPLPYNRCCWRAPPRIRPSRCACRPCASWPASPMTGATARRRSGRS